jgi:hypothetical protein
LIIELHLVIFLTLGVDFFARYVIINAVPKPLRGEADGDGIVGR